MRRQMFAGRLAVGLSAFGAIFVNAASARADNKCGSVAAGWNVPAGGAVLIVDAGIIHDVLAAVGEVRSHSMISHGPDSWVTHATATTPGTQQECSLPVDTTFLRASTPGLTTIDQGGAYTFIYNNGGTPAHVWYQRPTQLIANSGPLIANTLLPTNEFNDSFTWQPLGGNVWGRNFAYNNNGQLQNNAQIYYGWHQFLNVGSTPHGYPESNQQGWGVVCSTAISMWQHDALHNEAGYTGDMAPRTYSSSAITSAAWALFNDVYNKCSNGLQLNLDNGKQSASALWAASCFGQSVCGNAADEMVNTFVNNNSEDNQQGDWLNVVQHNTASSISPDTIGCWNGANVMNSPACSGTGSSIWGWDSNNDVQWNSGGNSYGCWAQ